MIPKHKSSEYFGFFAVSEKFAGIAGPALFAASVTLFASSRAAVLSIVVFFVAGALVLARVDVAAGEAQAQYDQKELATKALTGAQPSRDAS
jgi:UMF1 family MFS transporter